MTHESRSSQKFLFLEILDPEINGLLSGLRKEFAEGISESSIHITVRGPYSRLIRDEEIDKCRRILDNEPILLHGIGIFDNPEEYVVYMRVLGERLSKIWWKPDFPKSKHGFNPHISLYRGTDGILANKIEDFLKKESLKLLCMNYRLTPYTSKQTEMFPFERAPAEHLFLRLSNLRLVRPDIVQRASNLVRAHRREIAT